MPLSGIIRSTVPVGTKPPNDVIKRKNEAAKYPINLDASPELPPETLREFSQLAAERKRQKKKRSVTLRIAPDVLENYKMMGSGYTGIMADVLKYALDNPAILSQATR
jgi:uncharacterized protein (DUF4415 family)